MVICSSRNGGSCRRSGTLMKQEAEKLKAELAALGVRGIALDVDDVLADTRGQFAELFVARYGALSGLTMPEAKRRYWWANQWAELLPPELAAEARTWAFKWLHSDAAQYDVPLVENAHAMVQQISAIAPIVAYITARPVQVLPGTRAWLRKHAFPDRPVIARASADFPPSDNWKADMLSDLYPEVSAIVDDNIGLIAALPVGYRGTVYLYDCENYDGRSDVRVVVCPTWDDVYAAVTRDFGQK